MGFNHLQINLYNSPSEAPKYELPEYRYATIDGAAIVKGGTVSGKPTVDVLITDPETGQKYVAMITGHLLKTLSEVLSSVIPSTTN